MPGMDGLTLLREIKTRRPDLPVMMVTAYGDEERRRRAPHAATGMCDVVFRFALDSPLEGAVSSELVSEAKFPASWEITGNFVRLGLRVRFLARNPTTNSMIYDVIPYE
jgi:CheY-like chemotaxis protein